MNHAKTKKHILNKIAKSSELLTGKIGRAFRGANCAVLIETGVSPRFAIDTLKKPISFATNPDIANINKAFRP